jgi:hypothetical protein
LTGTSGTLFTLVSGGTFTSTSSSSINLESSSGTPTVASGSPTFYNLNINAGGVNYSLGEALTVTGGTDVRAGTLTTAGYTVNTGTLTLDGGTFTASSSTINLTGTAGTLYTYNSGTITPNSAPVNLTGNGSATVASGGPAFYTLTSTGTGTKSLGETLNVTGALTVSAGTFSTGSSQQINANNIVTNGTGTLSANSSVIHLSGISGTLFALSGSGIFTAGFSVVTLTGVSGTPTVASGSPAFYNLTTTGAGNFSLGEILTASNSLNVSAGTLTTNNYEIDAGIINVNGGTFTSGSSRIFLNGTGGTLFTRSGGGVITSNTSEVLLSGNGNATVASGNPYIYELMSSGTGTKSLGETLNVSSELGVTAGTFTTTSNNYAINADNLYIGSSSILNANNSTITLTGTGWTNLGTFTPGNSTVTLNGSITAIISGTTSFYNLSIINLTAAKEVDFIHFTTSSPIFTVTNNFTVTGSSSGLIKLHSDSSGNQWEFLPSSTATVNYASVKDGGCQSGAISINTTNSTDEGHNDACWVFASTPSITFSNTGNSLHFGTLANGSLRYATTTAGGSPTDSTAANTFSISTNAGSGYTLSYTGGPLTFSGKNIAGNISTGNPTASNSQWGMSGVMTSSGGGGAMATNYNYNASPSNWRFVSGETIASSTGPTTGTDTIGMHYEASISNIQAAGFYSQTNTWILTGNF